MSSESNERKSQHMSEVVTPLYGHTSPETAYLVQDYPYGFTLRCQIRYWIERKPSKGFRFGSQTTNPKRGNVWNKPKYSTYVEYAAAMYLDDNGHVQWRGVGVYSDPEKTADFVRLFPGVPFVELRAACRKKAALSHALATGAAHWEMNGKRMPTSDTENARNKAESEAWHAIVLELEKRVSP